MDLAKLAIAKPVSEIISASFRADNLSNQGPKQGSTPLTQASTDAAPSTSYTSGTNKNNNAVELTKLNRSESSAPVDSEHIVIDIPHQPRQEPVRSSQTSQRKRNLQAKACCIGICATAVTFTGVALIILTGMRNIQYHAYLKLAEQHDQQQRHQNFLATPQASPSTNYFVTPISSPLPDMPLSPLPSKAPWRLGGIGFAVGAVVAGMGICCCCLNFKSSDNPSLTQGGEHARGGGTDPAVGEFAYDMAGGHGRIDPQGEINVTDCGDCGGCSIM